MMFALPRKTFPLVLLVAVAGTVSTADAQTQQSAAQRVMDEMGLEEVVVTSRRELGAAIGDITPEFQLSAQEIRALGVGSVSELLAVLGPQLGSSRGRGSGRPIVLINGVRVSGFAEIRDIPTEAILRTDILPEEVALKYGYRADQRVVNFVLRPRFRAVTTEIGAGGTTDGGREGATLGGNWLRIQRDDRLQFDLKARRDEGLLESERRITAANGLPNADAAFRSLSPTVDQLTANAVLAKPLSEGSSFTINAALDDTRQRSLLGLRPSSTGPLPLRRDVDSREARLSGLLQGTRAGWRWSTNLNAERTDSGTSTGGETLVANSRSDSVDIDVVANGAPIDLPADPLNLTAKAGVSTRSIDSVSTRFGTRLATDLSRNQKDAQINVDLPLWRGEAEQAALGALGANFNYAIEDVSDVGSLRTLGYGLNWAMARKLRLILSVTDEDGAPTMQQLGGAVVSTPFSRVFDTTRNETVEVVRITGGNALLTPDRREVFKVGIGSRPFEEIDFDVNTDYVRTRSRNIIAGLPLATPDLERAFPTRFQRDPSGRLTTLDARAVNLQSRDRDELRISLNLSRPWGPQPEAPFPQRGGGGPRGADGRPPSGMPNPGGAPTAGAPTSGPPPSAEDDAARRARMAQIGERFLAFARRGSVQFSLSYTQRLQDEIALAPGLPILDLLDGDSLFDSGASARHELEVAVGANRDGFGGRLTTNWRSGSRVAGSAATQQGDLDFSSLTTVNLRLFADLGLQPWAQKYPSLRGARVSLVVGNLFNERQSVRAQNGVVPIIYQPDLLDPQGRTLRLTFRKLFFPSFQPPGGRTG
ncbi:MAG: hypothetical protein ACKO42_07170 [Gammaproteobacteria bacterium]